MPGHVEAKMNIRTVCGALILGGLAAGAASSTLSLAQSMDRAMSATKDTGVAAPKSTKEGANKTTKKSAAVNTNTNPTKHRYWRHRGGKHPHFGSRRVRSQVQPPQ
jgi:hypothetical protein